MALRSRLKAVERKLVPAPVRTVVIAVPFFTPGPDADLTGPIRIVVKDPDGNRRGLSGLREYYDITVMDHPA